MNPDEQALLNILIKESYITDEEAAKAAAETKQAQIPLLEYFLRSEKTPCGLAAELH